MLRRVGWRRHPRFQADGKAATVRAAEPFTQEPTVFRKSRACHRPCVCDQNSRAELPSAASQTVHYCCSVTCVCFLCLARFACGRVTDTNLATASNMFCVCSVCVCAASALPLQEFENCRSSCTRHRSICRKHNRCTGAREKLVPDFRVITLCCVVLCCVWGSADTCSAATYAQWVCSRHHPGHQTTVCDARIASTSHCKWVCVCVWSGAVLDIAQLRPDTRSHKGGVCCMCCIATVITLDLPTQRDDCSPRAGRCVHCSLLHCACTWCRRRIALLRPLRAPWG